MFVPGLNPMKTYLCLCLSARIFVWTCVSLDLWCIDSKIKRNRCLFLKKKFCHIKDDQPHRFLYKQKRVHFVKPQSVIDSVMECSRFLCDISTHTLAQVYFSCAQNKRRFLVLLIDIWQLTWIKLAFNSCTLNTNRQNPAKVKDFWLQS